DTSIVIPEFSVESKRVDFALCYPPDKPTIFIEIKQVGQSIGAEKQLFEYAFYQGIPMAILTDGQEWQFFLPAEQGEFSDRRVYKLDLLEREIEDIIDVLTKYLEYSNVKSGKAIEAARKDYKNIRQQREAVNTLHEAWTRLIEEGDELLIDLVTDKVESLCGYKPSPDQVIDFLSGKFIYASAPPKKMKMINSKKNETPHDTILEKGFELFGEFNAMRNARETMYAILNTLADRDPTFLHRYANLPKHGRSRRYVATNRRDLNPSRPKLAIKYSYEFRPGWYVNINLSKRTIETVIRLACQVANINLGKDLKLLL
ncbi:MAG: hypothetical protein ACTSQ8_24405, partial [Candidatus Helarchaeota archaeon]